MLPLFTEIQDDRVLQIQLILNGCFVVYCFIMSLITGNVSQVDRLWPIIPAFHSWVFVYLEYSNSTSSSTQTLYRLILASVLISLWCFRLVFNYWRKGGYSSETEDYRWEYVKKFFNYPQKTFLFTIFNLTFIAIYQCWLLLSIVLPLWYVQKYNRTEQFNYYDVLLAALFLLFLLIETIADQQQWNFQTAKYDWLKTKVNASKGYFSDVDFKRGFLTKGLFKYSRHPNFFAEMSLWWFIYAFTLSSAVSSLTLNGEINWNVWLNSSIYGTILLDLLFQGSTLLTENITLSKYKEYALYQSSVSRFVPLYSSYNDKKPY